MNDQIYEKAIQLKKQMVDLEEEIEHIDKMLKNIASGETKTTQLCDNISKSLKVPVAFFRDCLLNYKLECLKIKGALDIAFKLL